MSDTPSFREEYISQIPALQLLMQLGFRYLTPVEALRLRGSTHNVLLTPVLREWLATHNQITFKGQTHAFSAANLDLAIQQLLDEPYDGLVRTNQKLYERLTLGASLKQTIGGDSKSFSLQTIDWQHPENNVYHVTDEFEVTRTRSQQTRRPDIVCFVNGIPLVVIECKRPDKNNQGESAVLEGVSQMLRNQRDDEIPHLFVFSQLLLALNTNEALYATTRAEAKFWATWQEEQPQLSEATLHRAINTPLSEAEKRYLYDQREQPYAVRTYFDQLAAAGDRLPTAQDRTLYHLLRPERLLELIYQFVVYDGGVKKIARYQQYFAVKATLQRVAHLNHDGQRTGGIIWHTTGSGKSLTMVMLAKALTLQPTICNPKVILVTDRVDLDVQLYGTFKACGKIIARAQSGKDLMQLVQQSNADIIATVIDKFEAVAKEKVSDANPNIFVLVDESHRSQYGISHAQMKRVFPNACYLGFTGTPLLKKEKTTAAKFGDFIHKYPMRQAVADQAVVPLLYEGRLVELTPDQPSIDRWFERVTKELSDDQRRDLKRKFSRQGEVNQAEQRIQQIAYDLQEHYVRNFQHTGFKAQLAAPSKYIALRYHEFLEEFGEVSSAVVISAPDTREGNTTVDEEKLPKVQAFWKRMLERYQSEEAYNREIRESFAREDGVELLIVVDKLLTGFDEPRNTVLYIDKPLKEHGLLQAIARVNRLFENKPYGYIIDYRGVLGELNEAINTYDALAGFDSEDVLGTFQDVTSVIGELPQRHANVWAVFRPVANKRDPEQLQRYLEPEDIRQQFYEALRAFAQALQVALGAATFYETVPEAQIATYKRDLTFFHNLRNSVRQRYAETINYREYEEKIRKLMDRHISAQYITPVTAQVNIFDVGAFTAEVEKIEGAAARADTIAHQMKRTISERLEQDPAFYKKFSALIEETIAAYKQGRLTEAQYLEQIAHRYQQFANGATESTPAKLRSRKHAAAYYGVIREPLLAHLASAAANGQNAEDLSADLAIRIEDIIEQHKIRDWVHNPDVQAAMKNAVEDYLFSIKGRYAIALTWTEIDSLLEQIMHIAVQRSNL